PDAKSWATLLRLHSSFPDQVSGKEVHYQVGRVPFGMALMYGAGLISALLGIGSGVLKIPAMDAALRLPIKVSSATSNFMIGVTAAASAGAYFVRGDINIDIAGPIALGSVLGALAGARLLMGLSADKLRLFFVLVLVVLAVQMLLSALGIHVFGGAA
ncbi:MAG: sulfite exporter TauE/SafE family protein, partial [Betaproteobacteria bacterium]|nr:sulfite exporter TauE/SafE family protein [Betaproteobacteria bacterium]